MKAFSGVAYDTIIKVFENNFGDEDADAQCECVLYG